MKTKMSFRIDDILKRDTDTDSNKSREKEAKFFSHNYHRLESSSSSSIINNNNDSILQQTLQNKINFTPNYYRSPSDSAFHYDNWWKNFEISRLAANNYHNFYQHRGSLYPSLYARSWSYPNTSSGFMPHYSHYSKRKGGQIRFTTNQTEALENKFLSHKFLSPEDRKILAESLKLSDRQVKTWFQNRRAKWRRSSIGSSSDAPEELQMRRNSTQSIGTVNERSNV